MATITDVALRKAKAQEKPHKIAAGKEKLLALGPYPAVSLQDARQRCEEAQ